MNNTVLQLIENERASQDAQWGGPTHDDGHHPSDWIDFISSQVGKFYDGPGEAATKERLVKIAALAIAGLESIERQKQVTP